MLPLLAAVPPLLLVLGLAALVLPRLAGFGIAALSGMAGLLALTSLLVGGRASLSAAGLTFALDPLSAFFLLPVGIAGLAAGLCADRTPPVLLAGMVMSLLAADAIGLLLGIFLICGAIRGLLAERPGFAGLAAFGGACLLGALALLGGAGFDAMRAAPPEGVRAAIVLLLVLLGAAPLAGLAPLHAWLPQAAGPVAALLPVATTIGLYVIIRTLFDLCGPATPGWWAAPLLAMGAASAVLGALRAGLEPSLRGVLGAAGIAQSGLVAIGLGVALAARGADLAPLAALALGGAMLQAFNHGVFGTLAQLAAGAAQDGAGSQVLDRLGGLLHRMPAVATTLLIAAFCFAGLPPLPGFASEWLLFQAVLGAPRIGGLALQLSLVLTAAAMALAVGLGAVAATRLVGIALLGRPRSPRAAAAEDAPLRVRATLVGLTALCGLLGLLPGAALALSDGARQMLSAAGLGVRAGWSGLDGIGEAPGYLPLAVAALLAAGIGGIVLLGRRLRVPPPREAPLWAGGFAAPPAWLPFGDPATQASGLSLTQPLARSLGSTLLDARETAGQAQYSLTWTDPAESWLTVPLGRATGRLMRRADRLDQLTLNQWLGVTLAVLVAGLIAVAWVL